MGDGDEQAAEIAEFEERIKQAEMPPDVEKEAMRELDRLRRIPPAAAEYTVAPQIFVNGEHIGGCTELFDAFGEGRLQQMLKESGVEIVAAEGVDPYSFLPKWLHPRAS